MARQTGPVQLQGTIGDVTFVKTRHGYFARKRVTGVAERLKNAPRAQENRAEFTRIAKAGKIIRTAFRPISIGITDPDMNTRLNGGLARAVKEDTVNLRGERTPQNGALGLLQGFNFSGNTPLSSRFAVQPIANIDRTAGTAGVAALAFAPGKMVTAPEGATHFNLIAGLAQIDFVTGAYQLSQARSADFSANSLIEVESQLTMPFEPTEDLVLMLAYGIEFKQAVNGQMYPLSDTSFNALTIIVVDQPAA